MIILQLQELTMSLLFSLSPCIFQNDEPFVDDSFPPDLKSLYYNPSTIKDNHVVKWLRPHQIQMDGDSDLDWTIFRTPLPSDISQGPCNIKKYLSFVHLLTYLLIHF